MNGLDLPEDPLLGADPLASAAVHRLGQRGADAAPERIRDSERGLAAARDFEAVLLHRLMEAMRQTVPEAGLLSSPATRQMESLFWFYLSQEVARKGGIGLWKDLARNLNLAGGESPVPPAEGPQA